MAVSKSWYLNALIAFSQVAVTSSRSGGRAGAVAAAGGSAAELASGFATENRSAGSSIARTAQLALTR